MNRNLHGREHIEITQASLAEFRRENAAKEKILRQQRNERETEAALAVLEGEEPTRQPTPASSTHKTSTTAFRENTGPKSSLQNFTDPDEDKLIIFKRH